MCVAIYKPKKTNLPSLEILKQCWDANPDGAGFALRTDGEYSIEIHKGYMTWKQFVSAYEKYHLADFTGDLLLHFRIATHGGISPGLTHPFSLTKDMKLLKHTNVKTNYALIHNGMLPIESKDGSDTMEFCRRLAPLYQNIPAALELIQGMAGNNKIAVMTRDKVHLFGEWECIDGVYFSNTLWDWQGFGDDFMDFSDTDYQILETGYCPYCEAPVKHNAAGYFCSDCELEWPVRQLFIS